MDPYLITLLVVGAVFVLWLLGLATVVLVMAMRTLAHEEDERDPYASLLGKTHKNTCK